jgi:hypothetical protein
MSIKYTLQIIYLFISSKVGILILFDNQNIITVASYLQQICIQVIISYVIGLWIFFIIIFSLIFVFSLTH